MGIGINTNVSAMNAARHLNKTQRNLSKSFEKLSSGFRINRAADDAGGFKISERMTAQVRGLGQAVKNANDGISLVQTVEGALSETTNNLQRIRELSVQSTNGSYTSEDRESLQQEVTSLVNEIDRIAADTTFNGRTVLDGSYNNVDFQVGADSNQTINISIDSSEADDMGSIATKTDGSATTGAITGGASSNVSINGTAIKASADYATGVNGIDSDSALAIAKAINASNAGVSASAQENVVTGDTTNFNNADLDINGVTVAALDSSDGSMTTDELVNAINDHSTETGVAASVDASDQLVLTASDGRNITVGITDSAGASNSADAGLSAGTTNSSVALTSTSNISVTDTGDILGYGGSITITTDNKSVKDIDISTAEGAQEAIDRIDSAIDKIGNQRGALGAKQNRLEKTISNLSNVQENVTAARSQIMDVDFATETVNMTKGQLLQQAGAAVLSQAKASSQFAVSLLQ